MSILVLGATGLLGNAVFRVLSEFGDSLVFGTIRNSKARQFFSPELAGQLVVVEDLRDEAQMIQLFDELRPSVVINCISLSKDNQQKPMEVLSIFSIFPRRLAHLCRLHHIRLIQISSDGVFNGNRGSYTENDFPDAQDSYGMAKFLGEVDRPGVLTLRTSIIGHEIISKNGLLEWFLLQNKVCTGYRRVLFSGFPAIVLAQVIRNVILPRAELEGIYHLSTSPISKFDLLHLIAQRYNHSILIESDDKITRNLSLSADKFMRRTGYVAPAWPEMIDVMYSYKFGLRKSNV